MRKNKFNSRIYTNICLERNERNESYYEKNIKRYGFKK